jgi:hypothetical protein
LFGKLATSNSPKVAEATKHFNDAMVKFIKVLDETVDAGLVKDEVAKLFAVHDAQWKAHGEAFVNAVVARLEMFYSARIYLAELEGKAAAMEMTAAGLERMAAIPQRKAPATIVREVAVLPYVPGMQGSVADMIQYSSTAEYITELQGKAATPAVPQPQQLSLLPESIAATVAATVTAMKDLQPASSGEWEALWEALEDQGVYRFNKADGTLEQLEDGSEEWLEAATKASRKK